MNSKHNFETLAQEAQYEFGLKNYEASVKILESA